MSYYIQDENSTLNGYPQVTDLFPDGVQSKSELVDFLDEAFAEVKNDPEIEGVVNWVSYWTGFNVGAGTVYALSTEYANQIGYNGPTTAKTQNFILVLDKYIEQNVRDLMAKSKSTTKSFSEMVKSQRAKNIRKGLGPEITADVNQLDDIAYLADAIHFEMESVADGIQEKAPAEIGFKCSVDEYKQKLLECKQMADWLVNNVEFWTFM